MTRAVAAVAGLTTAGFSRLEAESDEDAHSHALELAADALTRPRRRSGKRYDCIIESCDLDRA